MKIFGVSVKALVTQTLRICFSFSAVILVSSFGIEIVGILMSETSLTARRVLVITAASLIGFVICIPIALIVGWLQLKIIEEDDDSSNTP